MIQQSEYVIRRAKLFELLSEHSIAILFSGKGKKVSADEFHYEVNKNFYYLTGIEQENSILLMVKSDNERTCYLFVDEKDPKVEKWTGYKLEPDQAKEISGIDNVFLRSAFDGKMLTFFENTDTHFGEITKIYLDLEEELKIGDMKSTQAYKKELEVVHKLQVEDLHSKVESLRMVKSEAEIELIKEAINTTGVAINHALIELKPGIFEYNLRNVFEFNVFQDECAELAFHPIIAGGVNAVVLHYPTAKDALNDGELVLFDVGARKDYYCGDISRTYPINGKFSDIQRTIYEIVLNCNKETINFMRPGVTLKEVNEFAKNFLADECFEKGLIRSKEEISNVYYHSVSHHLGLDTHDGSDRTSVLVPGNVITCEPGLYFKDLKIGVRIEDDVLITENGSENLSYNIVKELSDIEKLLRSK